MQWTSADGVSTILPGVDIVTATRVSHAVLDAIERRASLRIRAGSAKHRFLGIWAVVVNGRVFVRPWNDKPDGWYRAWREDPLGAIEVASREIAVRAKAEDDAGVDTCSMTSLPPVVFAHLWSPMHRATQVIVLVLGLMVAAAVAIALVRRARGRTAIEMTLARDLQPGMLMAEATALLRRLEVPFTVDSTAEGTTIVRYGRRRRSPGTFSPTPSARRGSASTWESAVSTSGRSTISSSPRWRR
jgi:hypothetical protein